MGLEDVLFGVESRAAIISVSGARLLLLCPLGLSDPPFTSDKDEHDDENCKMFWFPLWQRWRRCWHWSCVSRGDKKIIHNADSACLSASCIPLSAVLTFLSEKTSFWGAKYQSSAIYRNWDICKLANQWTTKCCSILNWLRGDFKMYNGSCYFCHFCFSCCQHKKIPLCSLKSHVCWNWMPEQICTKNICWTESLRLWQSSHKNVTHCQWVIAGARYFLVLQGVSTGLQLILHCSTSVPSSCKNWSYFFICNRALCHKTGWCPNVQRWKRQQLLHRKDGHFDKWQLPRIRKEYIKFNVSTRDDDKTEVCWEENNTITDGGNTAPLFCWYHTEEKTI